jgi:hypothetical protein
MNMEFDGRTTRRGIMKKLTLDDLRALREEQKKQMQRRVTDATAEVIIGMGTCVQIVKDRLFRLLREGPHRQGPALENRSTWKVKPEDAKEIIAEQIVKGREVKRLLYKDEHQKQDRIKIEDIEFYQKQFRIVLRNCGVINPEKIDEYIARDGYAALEKALFEMKPEEVIDELKIVRPARPRRRGLPHLAQVGVLPGPATRSTWSATPTRATRARTWTAPPRGRPHSVIEAMTIAGYTIGASRASSTSAPSTRWPSSASR